jgi:nucleoside phosphorylase
MSDTPGRIAFIAPMPSELRPLVKALSLRPAEPPKTRNYVGVAGPIELLATRSGMGTQLAAAAAERLLDAAAIDHVMVVGIAGGMGSSAVGDVIFPEVVFDKDSKSEYRPSPLVDVTTRGRLVTHDDFDMKPAETRALVDDGFIAVDMETAAIAAVCERRGTPWSVVRVISDLVGVTPGDVIDLANADGTPNFSASLRYLVRHPKRIPQLVRLARDSQRAANRAAAEAARLLRLARA